MGIEPMSTTRKACAQPIDASLASMKDSFTIGEYTGEDNSCIFHIICMHIICIFVYKDIMLGLSIKPANILTLPDIVTYPIYFQTCFMHKTYTICHRHDTK